MNPYTVTPGYLAAAEVAVGADGDEALAYSAVPDEDAEAFTLAADENASPYAAAAGEENFSIGMFPDFGVQGAERPSRQPFLAAISVLTIFVVGVVALVLSLAVSIRPHVAQRPSLGQNVVAPMPAPPPKAAVPAPPAPLPRRHPPRSRHRFLPQHPLQPRSGASTRTDTGAGSGSCPCSAGSRATAHPPAHNSADHRPSRSGAADCPARW
ncbi:hypothetical protein I553_0937 [Mycobacterium xenopi 4042]|uniref:Uncharacterized protein n=1 Tax=Mycobacterium xenopi 4042 TaxID=1299334 RepID=X7ZB27_MYCXE|nr:hypothetical protein I553_0937 [Mycobacterium xenopi 4042]